MKCYLLKDSKTQKPIEQVGFEPTCFIYFSHFPAVFEPDFHIFGANFGSFYTFTHYDTDMALYCEKLYGIDEKSIISNYCTMATELLFPLGNLLEKIKEDIESFCPLVMRPVKCSRKK